MAKLAAGKGVEAKKGGKEPFTQQTPLKEVWPLFADRKTKKLALSDVAYVLRACGFTIYVDEEDKIKTEVEKVDGLGKPITYETLQAWVDEHSKQYVRTYDDAYNALGTLCHEGMIGDKIKPESFDKIIKIGGDGGLKSDAVPLDEFI